jgi:hypothetical protein
MGRGVIREVRPPSYRKAAAALDARYKRVPGDRALLVETARGLQAAVRSPRDPYLALRSTTRGWLSALTPTPAQVAALSDAIHDPRTQSKFKAPMQVHRSTTPTRTRWP